MDPKRERRILVTGGAGFIGSHLVRTLAMQGRSVAVVDSFSSDRKENLVAAVPYYRIDIMEKGALTAAFQEFLPTDVFHLAGDLSNRVGGSNINRLVETNVLGSINVAEASTMVGAERFIFASTAGVYGDIEEGIEALESDTFNPLSAYAASKASFELFLSALGKSNGMRNVVLRLANVYGPHQRATEDGGVVAIFTERLLRRQQITLYSAVNEGDGGCQRNFVFVDDVVAAMIRALDGDMEGTFNVATKEVHRTEELLQVVSQILGVDAQIHVMAPRLSEIKRSSLNCSKLMSLGWSPKVSLRDGVAETVAYFRNLVQLQTSLKQ